MLAAAALATLAVVTPAHSPRAQVPPERHVAAASSFGAPAPGRPVPAHGRHRAARWAIGPAPRPTPRPTGHRAATRHPSTTHPVAHPAAGDPGVTIADFHFTAPTATIHVGDTITWTNDGPSPHTATATDGSFDTGTLSRGQTASHTFAQTGTFTYICKIHPFMHGTIVVLAATTPTTTSTPPAPAPATSAPAPTTPSSPASPATPATPAAPATTTSAQAATAQPTLPVTGMDLLSALAAGAVLFVAGLALRRAVRP
jgi:plastocyanin